MRDRKDDRCVKNSPDRAKSNKPATIKCMDHWNYKTPEVQADKRTPLLWAAKGTDSRKRAGLPRFWSQVRLYYEWLWSGKWEKACSDVRATMERDMDWLHKKEMALSTWKSHHVHQIEWFILSLVSVLYLITAFKWSWQVPCPHSRPYPFSSITKSPCRLQQALWTTHPE